MFRNAEDVLATIRILSGKRVSLVLLDIGEVTGESGNGVAKLTLTILAAVAEWERDRLRERVIQAKEFGKLTGRFLGGACPFGYRIADVDGVKMLEEEPAEQEMIAEMERRRSAGASIRQIVRWTEEVGRPLSPHAVHNIVEKRKA